MPFLPFRDSLEERAGPIHTNLLLVLRPLHANFLGCHELLSLDLLLAIRSQQAGNEDAFHVSALLRLRIGVVLGSCLGLVDGEGLLMDHVKLF